MSKDIKMPHDERGSFGPKSKGWNKSGPSNQDQRGEYKPNKSGNGPGAQGQRGGFKKGSMGQKGRK